MAYLDGGPNNKRNVSKLENNYDIPVREPTESEKLKYS